METEKYTLLEAITALYNKEYEVFECGKTFIRLRDGVLEERYYMVKDWEGFRSPIFLNDKKNWTPAVNIEPFDIPGKKIAEYMIDNPMIAYENDSEEDANILRWNDSMRFVEWYDENCNVWHGDCVLTTEDLVANWRVCEMRH